MTKRYAQILKNKVHWIGELKVLPTDKAAGEFIDITGEDPVPKEGWLCRHGIFSKPPSIKYIDVRKLTQHEVNFLILRKLGYRMMKLPPVAI